MNFFFTMNPDQKIKKNIFYFWVGGQGVGVWWGRLTLVNFFLL